MPPIDSSFGILGLVAVIGYLLGSIPFGILVAKQLNLGDLRQLGSGNIGATNVLRTGNKGAAALTLLLDALKGFLAVVLGRLIAGEDAAQLAGLCAFLGHIFPVWIGFKGGKGVATFIGIMLALNFFVGVACCLTWLVIAAALRYSSMAALIMAALSTFWMFIFDYGFGVLFGVVLTILIYLTHLANIARLRAGTEPKIGQKENQA